MAMAQQFLQSRVGDTRFQQFPCEAMTQLMCTGPKACFAHSAGDQTGDGCGPKGSVRSIEA